MSSHYGWVGTPEIWAAVQLPEVGALGVVLCPPLGQEGVIAYRGLRLLADQLESRGVASIRYDPPGHGDAAPGNDADVFVAGAKTAAAVLRSTGCTKIAYVGLSSAALVASEAAQSGDALVLWSPPRSGRVWLRKARSLATMELGTERSSGEFESLIGLALTPEQVKMLGNITLSLPGDAPALVAVRPGEAPPPGLENAEITEVEGIAEFLDTPSMTSVLPVKAIRAIADWLAQHNGPEPVALIAPELSAELVLPHSVERIRWLGPHRLFAIECSPRDVDPAAPMVLLHSGAAEHRVGAGDFQVELARLLASDGARSVRADRRTAGETGPVIPDEPSLFYSGEWVADQDAMLADLGVPGDRLALTGLCAGGWLAGQQSIVDPRLVVAIHPLEYRIDPAPAGEYVDEIRPEENDDPGRRRLRHLYHRWAPVWLRKLRDRVKGRSSAAPFLSATSARSWRTVLIFSDLEKMIFERRDGSKAAAQLPGIELINLDSKDHALYAQTTRQNVIREVRREVSEAFNLGSATTPGSTDQ